MRKRIFINIILALLVSVLFSCSEFRKIQKSNDADLKYEAAMNYYEKEDYYRAAILFEEVLPLIIGSEKAEKAQYFFAYSHFKQGNYLLSSHYFETFFTTYRRSEYAEEALFMHAFSLYKESPRYNLDQTETVEAINAVQNFINLYPRSEYIIQANDIIDQLQAKLERKAFEKAEQYYKLNRLNAAVVAFENFRKDFPDSDMNEEASFLLIEAQYKYAVNSIPSRQRERLIEAKEFYEQFIDRYAQSKYSRDAEKIYADIINNLSKINENNS